MKWIGIGFIVVFVEKGRGIDLKYTYTEGLKKSYQYVVGECTKALVS